MIASAVRLSRMAVFVFKELGLSSFNQRYKSGQAFHYIFFFLPFENLSVREKGYRFNPSPNAPQHQFALETKSLFQPSIYPLQKPCSN
jgi:hypothetical protein